MLRTEFINKIYIYRYGGVFEKTAAAVVFDPIGVLTIRTNQSNIQTESQLFQSLSFELKALFLAGKKKSCNPTPELDG